MKSLLQFFDRNEIRHYQSLIWFSAVLALMAISDLVFSTSLFGFKSPMAMGISAIGFCIATIVCIWHFRTGNIERVKQDMDNRTIRNSTDRTLVIVSTIVTAICSLGFFANFATALHAPLAKLLGVDYPQPPAFFVMSGALTYLCLFMAASCYNQLNKTKNQPAVPSAS